MKKFNSIPAQTNMVPVVAVLTGATHGPYWPCPNSEINSPVSAWSCFSDDPTHGPASQPWCILVLVLMRLEAPAAWEGEIPVSPSSSFEPDGFCPQTPKYSCSLSPSAARRPPEPSVLLLSLCCRREMLHTIFVLTGFGKKQ